MKVETLDYEEIGKLAREELQNLDLPEDSLKRISDLVQAYIDLQDHRNYYSGHSEFSLKLADIPVDMTNQLERVASKLRISKGRLVNLMMQSVLEKENLELTSKDLQRYYRPPGSVVKHINHLIVNRTELAEVEYVHFRHIGSLEFADDVDQEVFDNHVGSIEHCSNTSIPDHITKLSVMAKTRFCKSFNIRRTQKEE